MGLFGGDMKESRNEASANIADSAWDIININFIHFHI